LAVKYQERKGIQRERTERGSIMDEGKYGKKDKRGGKKGNNQE